MKKLFGLFLLSLAFFAPDLAHAANRFAVCTTTCTWDSASTAMWSTSTGGATGASVPGASDAVIFDAATCVGGVTCTITADATISGSTYQSITAGACTASTTGCVLNFNTNNPNMTFTSSVSFSGAGTRTINMGSGTWTLSGTTFNPAEFDCTTTTGLTATFQNASIVYSGNSVLRAFNGGGQTYGSLTINNNSTKGMISFSGANTHASITVGSGNTLLFPQGTTTTISGALNTTGTSSAPSGAQSSGPTTNAATLSVGSASAWDWVSVLRITKAGAGSIAATNALDLGGNTLTSISAPSGGGSGGGRIIGG